MLPGIGKGGIGGSVQIGEVDDPLDSCRDGSINQCIHVTRNAGRVVVTAIPPEVRVPLEFHTMRRKEIALFNVRRSNHESQEALGMLSDCIGRFAPMITHTRPLDEIGSAFSQLERYQDGVGKILITSPCP